uniref:HAUS augmin like complex subunit 2 n=1 Tax=Nothoprocta perdicaria TaxID=30464 RepID=A0A8C6YR38_NOTPE
MAAANPWDEGQPTAAGAALARCLEAGVVSQETLDLLCPRAPCFVKFSERERVANLQAELNQKKMEIEILELEKETADITHPFYLNQKYQILQDMNNHLEAVLKEKRSLRQRLIKPRCQDSLPIEAPFHKYIVELLTEAVNFIEKLETHLQTVRSVPQIPTLMKNMVSKMLVRDLEELTEQIVKWREVQKEVHSDSICSPGEFDFRWTFKELPFSSLLNANMLNINIK